ncbi:permease prefix domain 2-containing transporter [Aquiflexum sp.]|uniref:permease prefix domain 2-containing transporter n=1 Tax=Aquiflexum sp. TaxID=1872584 RepID=UPI0035943610
MKNAPQKLPHSFFRWFCQQEFLNYIEGDLMELYDERGREFGKRKGDIKQITEVLLLFRPDLIRSTKR